MNDKIHFSISVIGLMLIAVFASACATRTPTAETRTPVLTAKGTFPSTVVIWDPLELFTTPIAMKTQTPVPTAVPSRRNPISQPVPPKITPPCDPPMPRISSESIVREIYNYLQSHYPGQQPPGNVWNCSRNICEYADLVMTINDKFPSAEITIDSSTGFRWQGLLRYRQVPDERWCTFRIEVAGLTEIAVNVAPTRTPFPTLTPTPTFTPAPTFTPVPIATWLSQNIPPDTTISFTWEDIARQKSLSVAIRADGSFLYEDRDRSQRTTQDGKISLEHLKQIILKFDTVNFFAMADQLGCAYYSTRLPPAAGVPTAVARSDAPRTTIAITINRVSKSITSNSACSYDPEANRAIGELSSEILKIVP